MSNLISKIAIASENESSGFVQYDLKDANAVHTADKGVANGVATLDNAGKVPSSQLPSYVDDVIEGYYHNNKFYAMYTPDEGGTYSDEISAETGKIYVDKNTSISYRWSGTTYIIIGSSEVVLTIGTSTIAVMSQNAVTEELENKADLDSTVSTVAYDTANKKITKTINGVTTDVISSSDIVTDGGGIKQHLDISGKSDKSETVTAVTYDTTNKKITDTINGVTTDVVTISLIKTDLNLDKSDVGLDNVTNDAQVKRSEMGVGDGVATLNNSGKLTTSQIPVASSSQLGGIKIGQNLYINPEGVLDSTPDKLGFGIGTCTTAAATAAKEVSITGYQLVKNGYVSVTFENSVPADATLNINSLGAKPIIFKGEAIVANVINAGDTVTFCYDGTDYIISHPMKVSKVTIRTWSDAEKTTPTEAILYLTLPNSEAKQIRISASGVYTLYSVEGNATVSSLYSLLDINSFVINGDTTVDIVVATTPFVDMGLPSGTFWARGNICKDSNGVYSMGVPTDYGCYFSWGNIIGYNMTQDDTYNFTTNNYALTSGSQLTASIASNDSEHDAALARLGGDWHMPTVTQSAELFNSNNCTFTKTTVDGVTGMLITSKSNDNTIFLPCTGLCDGAANNTLNNLGHYRLSTLYSSSIAYCMRFGGSSPHPNYNAYSRYMGMTIRAVL